MITALGEHVYLKTLTNQVRTVHDERNQKRNDWKRDAWSHKYIPYARLGSANEHVKQETQLKTIEKS